MNQDIIDNAIREAERFIACAKEARIRFVRDWQIDKKRLGLVNQRLYHNISKENAACKRASLDLTRALAELRK